MKTVVKWQPIAAAVILAMAASLAQAGTLKHPKAHLSGASEVPPVETRAQGEVQFRLNEEGTELSYTLVVSNLWDVVAAHIHSGTVGVNGPVVVLLFGGPTTTGRTNGILAEGTITAVDLTGPLSGMTMDDLLELINSGGAYVNVHTVANPSGEIRGQL